MKKLLIGLAIAFSGLFVANTASAQDNIFSAGLEFGLPLGDFGDVANFGIGASAAYEIGITDNFSVMESVRYIYYLTEGDGVTIGNIPIQVGGRYYFEEQRAGAYGQVNVGVNITSASYDSDFVDNTSETNFTLAPEIGYFLSENISLGLRYQIIFIPEQEVTTTIPFLGEMTSTTDAYTNNLLALRAAYNF